MSYDPLKHHRRSVRLKGYDYASPAAYYVTIDTHDRGPLFGEITFAEMHLNKWGKIADAFWRAIPDHFPNTELDEFIIMPNHMHGIITITENNRDTTGSVGARQCRAPTIPTPNGKNGSFVTINRRAPTAERFGQPVPGSIPTIILTYKSAVTKRINQMRGTPGATVWQRDYWEHIIRDEHELSRIRRYIRNNPMQWENDLEG